MATTLKCGEWRCTRYNSPVENWVDDRGYEERSKNQPPTASLKNLRCNFHVGVNKRAKYSGREVFPLTEKDRNRLLAEKTKVDAAEREAAEQRAVEADNRAAQRHAEEWAFMDLPGGHRIIATDRSLFTPGEPTFEGKVWAGDEPQERIDNRWFTVQPSERHYGEAKPGERLWPYVIRVTRGANLSPNEARALAAALIEAADKADELNEGRR
jgi:hypothetical protein